MNHSEQIQDELDDVYMSQSEDLERKIDLLTTRRRMLEVSDEKNIHKQKVIYSYLAIILAIGALMIIILMVGRARAAPIL